MRRRRSKEYVVSRFMNDALSSPHTAPHASQRRQESTVFVSRRIPKLTALASAILACTAVFGIAAAPAGASTAQETVTAGSLSFIAASPGNITFPPPVLHGTEQAT